MTLPAHTNGTKYLFEEVFIVVSTVNSLSVMKPTGQHHKHNLAFTPPFIGQPSPMYWHLRSSVQHLPDKASWSTGHGVKLVLKNETDNIQLQQKNGVYQ
jgi:hypothetical protein